MHATIKTNKNIVRVIQYHELKVDHSKAECILADNFVKNKDDLSRVDKLYHFQRLMVLNELSEKNTLHVFLEFAPDEKIANDKLALVAREYMKRMSWDHQPWLVYRHNDTLTPHAHIVSTIIQEKGKRMKIPRSDYYKSRKVTKELEKRHSLQLSNAATRKEQLKQFRLQKLEYGKMPLLTAMAKVLEAVVPVYLYTSLSELNAVLRLYNMEASRGKEQSFIYRNGGLIFQPLTADGKPEGQYIKASAFDSRPTLKNLEKRFAQNQSLREAHRRHLTTAIDWTLAGKAPDWNGFVAALGRARIGVRPQPDKDGGPEQIWYVDYQSRTVFEGTALGAKYTAESIRQRCAQTLAPAEQQSLQQKLVKEHRLRL
jgi:hypothetical protein